MAASKTLANHDLNGSIKRSPGPLSMLKGLMRIFRRPYVYKTVDHKPKSVHNPFLKYKTNEEPKAAHKPSSVHTKPETYYKPIPQYKPAEPSYKPVFVHKEPDIYYKPVPEYHAPEPFYKPHKETKHVPVNTQPHNCWLRQKETIPYFKSFKISKK